MKREWHIFLYGTVQGVGLRWAISKFAEKNLIPGYVRNLPDKSVEILLKCDKSQADQFIEQLSVICPLAVITRVILRQDISHYKFDKFEILY